MRYNGRMSTRRFDHIDLLRAIGIIGVIMTHVYSYHLDSRSHFLIWNYLHFVVVAFVFCSGYVMAARYEIDFRNLPHLLAWYRKRVLRLVIPFYIYLAFHYILMIVAPMGFNGLGLKTTVPFLLQSITLTGGIDLNWLPLLFVQLTILYPFVRYSLKHRPLRILITAFTIGGAALFTIIPFPREHYRWVMWIPWLFFIILADSFYQREQKGVSVRRYLIALATGAALFAALTLSWPALHRSYTLTDNKYPPDLLYLSYATAMTFLTLSLIHTPLFQVSALKRVLQYISRQSYQLFFIHYILIDLMLHFPALPQEPFIQTLIVIPASLGVSYAADMVWTGIRGRNAV